MLFKQFVFILASVVMVVHAPTDPFTVTKPQDQEIGEFHVVYGHHATDFEAPKLRKRRSGHK